MLFLSTMFLKSSFDVIIVNYFFFVEKKTLRSHVLGNKKIFLLLYLVFENLMLSCLYAWPHT
jgi:hypothetical protein